MVSFTYPENWNCFQKLCDTYPRTMGMSKIFRITVEEALANKMRKSNQSIEDFAEKYAFNLESDISVWKSAVKAMKPDEIRELAKLLKKRESLVSEELFKRTL